MKAARFDYVRPTTLPEALALLVEAPDAKVLAGGQTLGPMLNLRLAQPPLLVDIARIAELAEVAEDRDSVTLGATITHAAVEDGRVTDPTAGFLARVAAGIGYRAVRTRGTIGGSLAHADPAADWLVALTALAAELNVAGPAGRRRLALSSFVEGAMQTVLKSTELITSVRLAKFSSAARFGYHKICRKVGEFADAIGAVADDPERGVRRLAVSTLAGAPLLLETQCRTSETVPEMAQLEDELRHAGFSGDAYETRLRAVVLRRAAIAMANR
jgi:aerobic carbon-monoxide dehydrogenase medium subunit